MFHKSSNKSTATLPVSAMSHRKKYEVPRNELSRKNSATLSPLFILYGSLGAIIISLIYVPFDEFKSSINHEPLKFTLVCFRETVICVAKYSRPSASRHITAPLATVKPSEPFESVKYKTKYKTLLLSITVAEESAIFSGGDTVFGASIPYQWG